MFTAAKWWWWWRLLKQCRWWWWWWWWWWWVQGRRRGDWLLKAVVCDWRKINWGDDQQVRERANQVITQPIREKEQEQTCKMELISWLMIECVQQQQQKLDWGNRTDNKQTRNDIFQVLLTVIMKSRGRMCRHWPHTASVWQLKLQRVKEWRTSKKRKRVERIPLFTDCWLLLPNSSNNW